MMPAFKRMVFGSDNDSDGINTPHIHCGNLLTMERKK